MTDKTDALVALVEEMSDPPTKTHEATLEAIAQWGRRLREALAAQAPAALDHPRSRVPCRANGGRSQGHGLLLGGIAHV